MTSPFSFGGSTAGGSGNNPFAAKNTSQAPSQNLFGTSGASTSGPASSFGQPAPSSTSSAPSLFGGLNKTSGGTTGGLFGGGGPSSNPGSGASTPLFGASTGNAPAGGGLFGSKPAATPATSSAPSSGLFGGGGAGGSAFSFTQNKTGSGNSTPATNNENSIPAAATSNLFGYTKPLFGSVNTSSAQASSTTPAKPTSSLFNSTTPAGPPPTDNGQKPAGSNLFGGLNNKPSGGISFGAANSSSTAAPTSKPLFGGGNTTGPSLFGNLNSSTPTSTTTSSATPATTTQPSFSFQSSTPVTSPALPASGQTLFGTKPAANAPASTPAATSNMFSNLGGTSSGASKVPTPNSNMFGSLGGGSTTANSTTPSASTPAAGTTSGSGTKLPSFGGLGVGTPATSAPASSAPTTSNLFGSTPVTSASTTTNLFSGTATTSAPTSSAPPPAKPSLFVAAPTSSAPTFSTATTPSLFGNPATTAPASSTPATTAPMPSLFGSTSTAPQLTSTASTAPNSTAATAGGATTLPPGAALKTSTAGPAPGIMRLKNKTMDEIITRWASDLSKYQKDFKEQADKVAAWDRLMVENGEKIQKLFFNTFEAEKANSEIERQLNTVSQQQDELTEWLDKYEHEVDQMFERQLGETMQGPDQERERTYKLAEKLTERLDEMGKGLSSMIEAINDASTTLSKTGKQDDPLSTIVRVLNEHLQTLQWIDENAAALQAKVSEAQKMGQSMGSNGYGGVESDAAESFYRSYLGRK